MVLQAASLLRDPKLPSDQILDFLWLLSTKATLAANVDSFVCIDQAMMTSADDNSCTSLVQSCLRCKGSQEIRLTSRLWSRFDSHANGARLMLVALRLLAVNPDAIEAIVAEDLSANR
jgi:hypothetical protein